MNLTQNLSVCITLRQLIIINFIFYKTNFLFFISIEIVRNLRQFIGLINALVELINYKSGREFRCLYD